MTDRRHRDRALPEGYQFGDAGRPWRRPSDNAADQLRRRAHATIPETAPRLALSTIHDPDQWNVIEGEDH